MVSIGRSSRRTTYFPSLFDFPYLSCILPCERTVQCKRFLLLNREIYLLPCLITRQQNLLVRFVLGAVAFLHRSRPCPAPELQLSALHSSKKMMQFTEIQTSRDYEQMPGILLMREQYDGKTQKKSGPSYFLLTPSADRFLFAFNLEKYRIFIQLLTSLSYICLLPSLRSHSKAAKIDNYNLV